MAKSEPKSIFTKPAPPREEPKPFEAFAVVRDGDTWSLLAVTVTGDRATSRKVHERDAKGICLDKAMRAMEGER